jgi:hypothetical protein
MMPGGATPPLAAARICRDFLAENGLGTPGTSFAPALIVQ